MSLIKIHEGTILHCEVYHKDSLSFDAETLNEFGVFMSRQDFQTAAQQFFESFYPDSCDIFMWELKRLVDKAIIERQKELLKRGVKDERTENP